MPNAGRKIMTSSGLRSSGGGALVDEPMLFAAPMFCARCKEQKTEKDFYPQSAGVKLQTACKKCVEAKRNEWRAKNPDRKKKTALSFYHRNKHKTAPIMNAKRRANPDRYRRWNKENKNRLNELARARKKKNPIPHKASVVARRAQKLKAMPKWIDRKLFLPIYAEAKEKKMHVDHIVPLRHPDVCGLHVPWNLQLLTAQQNQSKGNKFDPDAACQ